MWHLKGKIIGWYEDGQWTFGTVTGKYFEKRQRFGIVEVEIMGGKGWWTKFEVGFDRCVTVGAGKVWVWFEGRGWRRCGK